MKVPRRTETRLVTPIACERLNGTEPEYVICEIDPATSGSRRGDFVSVVFLFFLQRPDRV